MARNFSLGGHSGPNFDGCVPTFDAPVHVTARILTGRAPAVALLHGLGDSRLAFEDAFATR
jgi:hypothetical protein